MAHRGDVTGGSGCTAPLSVTDSSQKLRSWRLLNSDHVDPMDGNPKEMRILEPAEQIRNLTRGRSFIGWTNSPKDDPEVPCLDMSLAVSTLERKPTILLEDGLTQSIEQGRGAWGEA